MIEVKRPALKKFSIPASGIADYRRAPKTSFFCIICHRDILPGQHHRMIHIIDGGDFILHPSDEVNYQPDGGDCGAHPVGGSCARKIGAEWTHAPKEGAAS
jgi:hypothetical protein